MTTGLIKYLVKSDRRTVGWDRSHAHQEPLSRRPAATTTTRTDDWD